MKKLRLVLGFLAGAMLLASSAAHSLLGWKAVKALLDQAKVPIDLQRGLAISWYFGGVAMLAFGLIVLAVFNRLRQGRPVSLFPVQVIAVAYLGIGAWALAVSHNPFYMVFVIPGLLLSIAGWGSAE